MDMTLTYGTELLNANEQLRRDRTGTLLIVNAATAGQVKFPLATGRETCVHRTSMAFTILDVRVPIAKEEGQYGDTPS